MGKLSVLHSHSMGVKTFTNSFYAYIENGKNDYPAVDTAKTTNPITYKTGYHRIPNQVWSDFLNPSQWFDLVYNSAKFRVVSASCIVSNMIPLTEQVAIQGNATFTTFNNTIYAICYEDHAYETDWEETVATNLDNFWHREGLTNKARFMLPTYTHSIFRTTSIPNGVADLELITMAWDPLIKAEDIKELRPGKNAVQFSWSADEIRFLNCHMMQSFDPTFTPGTQGTSTVYSQEVHMFNTMNITPHNKLNKWALMGDLNDPARGFKKQDAVKFPGVDEQNYLKPIPNWFIKMIPLFDSTNNLIKTTAQVLITMKLTVEIIPDNRAVQVPNIHGLLTLNYTPGTMPSALFHVKGTQQQNEGVLAIGQSVKGATVPEVKNSNM
uniref:NS1 protein n=1 Tax=Pleurosicya ichthamaparvovirus TaxID=3156507 RepID=A0AAU7BB52_9VIRU